MKGTIDVEGGPRTAQMGFITVAGPTERRLFFLGASWTSDALDPGEVLWDTGAQEGLVGEQRNSGANCLRNMSTGRMESGESQHPQAVSEVRRSQSMLYVCQPDWPGATVSSASLLWSRMFHHYCR